MAGVIFLTGTDIYFLCNRFQTGSEAHPASCLMGAGNLFRGCKLPVREADISLPEMEHSVLGDTAPFSCMFY
jgi:hypothetical protein